MHAIKHGLQYEGTFEVPHSIGTAAVFLKGGTSINPDAMIALSDDVQEAWPDAILFLEAGMVVTKTYETDKNGQPTYRGLLHFYNYGNDALLAFTSTVFGLLHERSVQVEDPLFLIRYAWTLQNTVPVTRDFPLTNWPPHRKRFWSPTIHPTET